MLSIDWIVLLGTIGFIISYGIWKTRKQNNLNDYFLGGAEAKWWTVGLSVMATQASAITFLSTPGQAFHDGMGFVQFYFGLPIAMILICIFFVPIYKRLKVFTAYEYLEQRFDRNTRVYTAILFLIQRGLAAGITIYAPAIILSTILGWNLKLTVVIIGLLVIIYTTLGGTKAVNVTHKQQMAVIFLGLFLAFFILLGKLPDGINFQNALQIAGQGGKMNVLDFSFDLNNRYTFWSGIIGGTFLALSYFGTDQSQVQRYLSSASIKESRYGLLFNAALKVPLQFFILLIGVMVFVFYQFNAAPVFFNTQTLEEAKVLDKEGRIQDLEAQYIGLIEERKTLLNQANSYTGYSTLVAKERMIRDEVKTVIEQVSPTAVVNDKDYVFLYFILNNIPKGILGLLLAMIFSAAMSSTAAELNALASTTTIDIYKRNFNPGLSGERSVWVSKGFTIFWGCVAILFASFGTLFENLIQFVNIIGSIFYGTILGIFLCGFFLPFIRARAVLISGLISEAIIIYLWWIDLVPFLWLNLIGSLLVIVIATIIQLIGPNKKELATLASS